MQIAVALLLTSLTNNVTATGATSRRWRGRLKFDFEKRAGRIGGGLEGSFEGTCSDCSQTGTTLTCTCKKSDGTSEVTSIPLDCNCPCGERKFSNNNGELTCCCDCHAGTRVALCPDGIAEPAECSGCPSYYGSRCGVQWNAPEPEAYTTECDD